MPDVLIEMFGGDTDAKAARKAAREIAELLGSKANPNKQIVLGESYCPFKIPVHTKQFYSFVFVSDVSFRFTANRRPQKGHVGDFFVSMKVPAAHMFAKTLVVEVSKKLGIDVFRQPFCSDKDVAAALLSQKFQELLRKVDFRSISQFHLSPIQLSVASSLQSTSSCAEQTRVFRDLITVAFEEAYERNKHANG